MLLACLIGLAIVALLQVCLLAFFTSAVGALRTLDSGLSEFGRQLVDIYSKVSEQADWLRSQNTDLHERLLAVHDAGAQARLAAQRSQTPALAPMGRTVEVALPRRRSPQEIDLPPSPPGPES